MQNDPFGFFLVLIFLVVLHARRSAKERNKIARRFEEERNKITRRFGGERNKFTRSFRRKGIEYSCL